MRVDRITFDQWQQKCFDHLAHMYTCRHIWFLRRLYGFFLVLYQITEKIVDVQCQRKQRISIQILKYLPPTACSTTLPIPQYITVTYESWITKSSHSTMFVTQINRNNYKMNYNCFRLFLWIVQWSPFDTLSLLRPLWYLTVHDPLLFSTSVALISKSILTSWMIQFHIM